MQRQSAGDCMEGIEYLGEIYPHSHKGCLRESVMSRNLDKGEEYKDLLRAWVKERVEDLQLNIDTIHFQITKDRGNEDINKGNPYLTVTVTVFSFLDEAELEQLFNKYNAEREDAWLQEVKENIPKWFDEAYKEVMNAQKDNDNT